MNKKFKIVTCASYGGTGSSAITDFLKEFDKVKSMGDFEFSIAHEVDGISDLQHYIVDDNHRLKCDEAIYRFYKLVDRLDEDYSEYVTDFKKISEDYIEDLVDFKWMGHWHQHMFRKGKVYKAFNYDIYLKMQFLYAKLFLRNRKYEFIPKFKLEPMYYVGFESDFIDKTRKYFNNVFNNLKIDNKDKYEYIALDQLVPYGNFNRYCEYFDNIKVIVVDRDPRDLYLLNKIYWNEGWIPTQDVDLYIKWFKAIRQHSKVYNEENPNVLRIKFEDLIFNYENSSTQIMEFLGLKEEDHVKKREFLNPDRSKKNTKLWLSHNQHKEDVAKIKSELAEFCYMD